MKHSVYIVWRKGEPVQSRVVRMATLGAQRHAGRAGNSQGVAALPLVLLLVQDFYRCAMGATFEKWFKIRHFLGDVLGDSDTLEISRLSELRQVTLRDMSRGTGGDNEVGPQFDSIADGRRTAVAIADGCKASDAETVQPVPQGAKRAGVIFAQRSYPR